MPQYMDYEGFKVFVESHFPDKVTVDERELEHGLYHELAIMEHEITIDDLESAYDCTFDILALAEKDFHEANPGKEPLDRVGIMRLMLSIGNIPYWEKHGLSHDKTWRLGPIVEKWRAELRKQGKMK